jgi:hypothetical protein
MLDISIDKHQEFYTTEGVNKCLEFLRNLDYTKYEYPKNVTNFHIYTELKTDKQRMVLKSFLATQNLEHTRLFVWSDYDITDNEILKPYLDYAEFKVYNPREEAKGTILEGSQWLNAKDSKHWMNSGILRFLVPHKYGGIWADMDMIFLRDLKPILDQEFAYMWGTSTDFARMKGGSDCYGPCAAFMNIHKNSEHSKICLEEIIKTKIRPNTTCLDHELLANVFRIKPFTVFPCVFFNTEWQMGEKGVAIQEGWFNKKDIPIRDLFLEAFSWHWHNTSNQNKIFCEGSKFDMLSRITGKKLIERGIL